MYFIVQVFAYTVKMFLGISYLRDRRPPKLLFAIFLLKISSLVNMLFNILLRVLK